MAAMHIPCFDLSSLVPSCLSRHFHYYLFPPYYILSFFSRNCPPPVGGGLPIGITVFVLSFYSFYFFAVTTNIPYVLKWPAIPFSSFSVTLLLGLLDYFVCYVYPMYALLEGLGSATSISELN